MLSRGKVFVALSVFSLLFLSTGVFAQTSSSSFSDSVLDFLTQIANILEPVFQYTLGDVEGVTGLEAGNILVIKVLVFVIMLSVFYLASTRTPVLQDNRALVWIVSVALGILATRFLSTASLIEFVWLPTGIVGIALTSLLPFAAFFFFIQSFDSGMLRKISWIFFMVLFFGLAIVRWPELAVSEGFFKNLGWIYIITGVLSLLLFYFDRSIHAAFAYAAIHERGAAAKTLQIHHIQTQIEQWRNVITNPQSTQAAVAQAKREILNSEKRIKQLLKS
ncbi:hypothetical protein HYZ97_04745 [Candidatus Pacearchaeota archaeon]|nr:hypothetical protein [Candidatus Pacearchaeota archaeon]